MNNSSFTASRSRTGLATAAHYLSSGLLDYPEYVAQAEDRLLQQLAELLAGACADGRQYVIEFLPLRRKQIPIADGMIVFERSMVVVVRNLADARPGEFVAEDDRLRIRREAFLAHYLGRPDIFDQKPILDNFALVHQAGHWLWQRIS